MITRPDRSEYAEFYASYISKVPEGDLIEFLGLQEAELDGLVRALTDQQASTSPAPGKWSIKQALGHVSDTERIMSYRVLRFARGDQKELQGFDQDPYVKNADFNSRATMDLLAEWKAVRGASMALLRSLSEPASTRTGVANGKSVSVRALAYVIAGHAQHHLELMRAQLGAAARP